MIKITESTKKTLGKASLLGAGAIAAGLLICESQALYYSLSRNNPEIQTVSTSGNESRAPFGCNPGSYLDRLPIIGYKSYGIPQVTRDSISDLIETSHNMPVFVKATAKWCGPCKALSNSYKQAAKQFNEVRTSGAYLMELDIDLFKDQNLEELFEAKGIDNIDELTTRGVPRLGVFYDGKLEKSIGGSVLAKYRKVGTFQNLIRETVENRLR